MPAAESSNGKRESVDIEVDYMNASDIRQMLGDMEDKGIKPVEQRGDLKNSERTNWWPNIWGICGSIRKR